jgi:hypothetical protein
LVIPWFGFPTLLRDRTSFVQAHIELNDGKKEKTRRVPNVTRIFNCDNDGGEKDALYTLF